MQTQGRMPPWDHITERPVGVKVQRSGNFAADEGVRIARAW